MPDPSPTSSKGRVILGLDPGLAITGYGIIRCSTKIQLIEAGVIRVRRDQPMETRLQELYTGVMELFESVPIDEVAVEQLYSHFDRPRTAILMGHARGVLFLAAANSGKAVTSYASTKVKSLLTGNGRAPKSQMQLAIQQQLMLKEVPDPPDVADALAVALCHHFATGPFAELLKKSRKPL
jgi:crossover junction endodeoxyribonuclease RuvC